jgi:hypothetical protein
MQETQRYSPDPTLSPVQHQVLSLLTQGVSTSAAAEAAGVHRNTVATWRRTGPAFARELEFAARERSMFWHDQAAALAEKAIAVLNEILDDKTASPSLRLRAAFKVIAMASDPQPGPMKPFPASAAEAEACIGQSLLLQTLANESEGQESENMHNSAQPPTEGRGIEKDVEKTAQNCTSRTTHPGRNAPCPCKSGLKYKRCCANRPSPPGSRRTR